MQKSLPGVYNREGSLCIRIYQSVYGSPLNGSAAGKACNQRDDEQHEENEEEDLSDTGSRAGYTAKPEQSRYKRDDKKNQGPS